METEKNPEEMMKELDEEIAELNKLKEELGLQDTDSAAAEAETQAEENVAEDPDDETIELFDEPLKWWQGAIVLGIPAVLGFVGGILAGVGIAKKD